MTEDLIGGRETIAPAQAMLRESTVSNRGKRADSGRPIRIILADDRRLCRECLRLLIETIAPELEVVEADSPDRIGALLEHEGGRSVVLYNLVTTDKAGLDFIGNLNKSLGDIPLVVMCDTDDGDVMCGSLEVGAKAFLPSRTPGPVMVAVLRLVIAGGIYAPPAMVMALSGGRARAGNRSAAAGRRATAIAEHFPMLTPRQRQVLAFLSQGQSNREIAKSLDMCENTVKAHVKQIMRKLHVENRTQAALMADRLAA